MMDTVTEYSNENQIPHANIRPGCSTLPYRGCGQIIACRHLWTFCFSRKGFRLEEPSVCSLFLSPKLTREKESGSDHSLQEEPPYKKLSSLSGQ